MNTKTIIILGTAHLLTTPGKGSPDGKFREARYSRLVCAEVKQRLQQKGFTVYVDYEPLQPSAAMKSNYWREEQERELQHRVNEVNRLCRKHGRENCIYVSIHVNAAGNGTGWMKAGGWCAFTTKGQTRADTLAGCLYEAAGKHLAAYASMLEEGKKAGWYGSSQRPLRTDFTDGDADCEADFYVLRKTPCPAVLTENLFQDNAHDVEFLTSKAGLEAIVRLHVDGICSYALK